MQINPVVVFIISALIAVTLIATLGAVASRRYNFRYSRFAVVSFLLYTVVGYGIGSKANVAAVIVASSAIGLFDSTVCWQLCLRCRANLSIEEQQIGVEMPAYFRVVMTMVVAVFCGVLGCLLAGN